MKGPSSGFLEKELCLKKVRWYDVEVFELTSRQAGRGLQELVITLSYYLSGVTFLPVGMNCEMYSNTQKWYKEKKANHLQPEFNDEL